MIKNAVCLMTLLSIFSLYSCALFHPNKDYQLLLIQRKLSETSQRIDKLNENVSLILAKLDSHDEAIGRLEASIRPAAAPQKVQRPSYKKSVAAPAAAPAVKADAAEIAYNRAITAYRRKQYDTARGLFASVLRDHPRHRLAKYSGFWLRYLEKQSAMTAARPAPAPAGRPARASGKTPRPKPAVVLKKPAPRPAAQGKPESLYSQGQTAYQRGDYKAALASFTSAAKSYPRSKMADNALYWAGECHYALNNYYDAIHVFQEVTRSYPESNKTPDALLKTGYAYLALADVSNATRFFQKVINEFPASPAAAKAREKLRDIEEKKNKQPDAPSNHIEAYKAAA